MPRGFLFGSEKRADEKYPWVSEDALDNNQHSIEVNNKLQCPNLPGDTTASESDISNAAMFPSNRHTQR